MLEYDGSSGAGGAVKTWYAYGPGSNAVVNRMDVAAGTRATLVADIQGSIVASLDSGSGTMTRWGYRPFGENPSLTTDSFAYTAQRHDPETSGGSAEPSGLYYDRARMYSPTLGRFLTPDPAGGSDNLYAYVGNDPLNMNDPSGMMAESVGSGASNLWNVYTDPSSYGNRDLYTGALAGSLQTLVGSGDAFQHIMSPSGVPQHPEFSESFDYSGIDDIRSFRPRNNVESAGQFGGAFLTSAALTSGAGALGGLPGEMASGFGDLTVNEVNAIRGVVSDAGRPLDVVGSAASATRRGIGSGLPIGKGFGTRSDIDYLVSHGSAPYFGGLTSRLPSLDPSSGVILGLPNRFIGPSIRFEPGMSPYFIPGH